MHLCRVFCDDRKLQGQMAFAPSKMNPPYTEDVTVQIIGQPDTTTLKYSNLRFLPSHVIFSEGFLGVDRNSLQDSSYTVTAFNDKEQYLKTSLSGGCERSRGNILAAKAHIEEFWNLVRQGGKKTYGVVLNCTDLNVATVINRMVDGHKKIAKNLCQYQVEDLRPIKGLMRSIKGYHGQPRTLYAVFRPELIQPDGYDPVTGSTKHWGTGRVQAALSGFFKIYPCPHAHHRNAMEVRFVADSQSSSKSTMMVRHEMYLDYGPEEAEIYVHNVVALGDIDRLLPKTLAKVDPQAFWSAVLHIEKFRDVLHARLSNTQICAEWDLIYQSVQMSHIRWQLEAWEAADFLPDAVIRGNNTTDWGIKTAKDQEKIGYVCALTALTMMFEAASVAETEFGRKLVKVQLLKCYEGLEIERITCALGVLYRKAKTSTCDGALISEGDYANFLKEALEQVGYGRQDAEYPTICAHCHDTDDGAEKICSKCHAVAYCNRLCQIADWKNHKEVCNPMQALTKRALHGLTKKQGVQLSAVTKTIPTLPTQPVPSFITSSGTGCVAIEKVSGTQNTFIIRIWSKESQEEPKMVRFRHPNELDPLLRLFMACGPFNDRVMATKCLDEAIASCAGDLTKLCWPFVGLSPLEWAAKWGNLTIVQWLSTDLRTHPLVLMGSPVGWACSEGHTAVARVLVRAYGANPYATDSCLYQSTPPLLLAAKGAHWLSMQFLVDECGQDIYTIGPEGENILQCIESTPNWNILTNHRIAHDWATTRMEQEVFSFSNYSEYGHPRMPAYCM